MFDYGWYSGWSTLLKAWCYYCLISNLNARIVGGESNLRRCFIRPVEEIGNGFGSKAPQIIKDPQDFHFRETFLEVCVTHVSFSCSSSPRFDQVPIEEYWEYWGFATFIFKKTEKRLYIIFDPSKNAKCFKFLFPGSPGVSALRRTPLWGESMDKFTFPLLSLLTRTDTFSPWECHTILSIDFFGKCFCANKQKDTFLVQISCCKLTQHKDNLWNCSLFFSPTYQICPDSPQLHDWASEDHSWEPH